MKQTLEQAAEAYSKPFYEISECGENYTCTPQDAFKAGAEWQKEQKPVDLEKFIEKAQRVLYSSNPDDYIKLVKELAELGRKGGNK